MGGCGSGRWQCGKNTTDDYRFLDVRRLQREGMLKPGQAYTWSWIRGGETVAAIQIRTEKDRLILDYRHRSGGGDWQPIEYSVWLNWTDCTFGGQRAWFICPARGCGRRVAVLYGGTIFACRHCHQLAYACQRERGYDRAARRADTIRKRLGWEPGIFNGPGWKPKGMHWRTFKRLKAEHDAFVGISLAGMGEWLGLMERQLADLGDDLNFNR